MKRRHLLLLAAPLALAACATEPQYPVRPGEPRAEMPKPTYPIRQPGDEDDAGGAPLPPPRPLTPPPTANSDSPTYYKPEPITGAALPPDERSSPSLRGRESPGPRMAVSSAPQPALETPHEVVVRPGESLFEVAERVRTPVRALIDVNGLKPPYEVEPGSTLKVPAPGVYTVKAGDTLFSIGRKFSIDPRSLANFNDISMDNGLRPGQRIALPASVTERDAPRPIPTATETGKSTLPPIGKREEGSASASPRTAVPPPPEPESTSPAVATAAGKGKFAWPVKGDILSTFGPKGPGQRNDGVNIAAKEGDTVKAAASGQVVYAGSTIPGFGNLVVIKHPDGWTSLYGNLGKISVKIRAEVSKGQEIGIAGISGPVDKPQVHFEVRYAGSPEEKARPVDPQQVLP